MMSKSGLLKRQLGRVWSRAREMYLFCCPVERKTQIVVVRVKVKAGAE